MSSVRRPPAIAGVAQLIQRTDDARTAAEPLALMERAIRAAAEDACAPRLIEAIDAIYVPQGLWRYGDPGRLLAERLGCPQASTVVGAISGHIVQLLVNRACREIAEGKRDVVAIVGAESENSKRRMLRDGQAVPWNDEIPGQPDARVGEHKMLSAAGEVRAGVRNPTTAFALCDTSLRRSLGESPSQHRDRISRLYEAMSEVAASNPYAWIQRATSADEIRNPSPDNRMVSYPYTKWMTSNISVDQGAALILCSAEAAARFGVPDSKLVRLRASTEMSHSVPLSERDVLHRHPGQELAAQRALELAATDAEALDYVDLYSCFPFAVQAGAAALGRSLDPVPSLTGGMTFFGGPFGNYVLHSKATLVERLRAEPGSMGLIGSVGGSFAHFSFGVYSTDPGECDRPLVQDVGEEFAAMPRRDFIDDYEGTACVEAYTVRVAHDGPKNATFAALTDDGRRVWALSEDLELLEELLRDEEGCGRQATVHDGHIELR